VSPWILVLFAVLLLLLSAFFVAAEFALVSAKRSVVEPLAVSDSRARTTLLAMEDVSLMMACAQLGITVSAVLLGTLGEPAVAALLEPVFHAVGVPDSWLHPVALTVALLLVVSAHVALGEMVPKNIAIASPERVALALGPTLRLIAKGLGPVLRGLNHFANGIVRMLGYQPRDEVASVFTREQVAGLISESSAEGLLDEEEHGRLTSALDFDDVSLARIVVPDARVFAVPVDATPANVESACARTGFSRFPVRGKDGTYLGYLHIRDVLAADDADRERPIPLSRIRVLPVLDQETTLRETLDRMRRAGAHLAEVVSSTVGPVSDGAPGGQDSAGGPVPVAETRRVGVVMLEDVIEELIGEVRDATRRHRQ
jgi:CBS domain containing-hemolysin-like protein